MAKIESKRLQRNPASSIHIGNCEYKRLLALVAGSNNNIKNVFKSRLQLLHRKVGSAILPKRKKAKGGCGSGYIYIVHELCDSRGGRPGLSVLTSLMVSVDVKQY